MAEKIQGLLGTDQKSLGEGAQARRKVFGLFAALAEPPALPAALPYPRGESRGGSDTTRLISIAHSVLEVDPGKIHQPTGYCSL